MNTIRVIGTSECETIRMAVIAVSFRYLTMTSESTLLGAQAEVAASALGLLRIGKAIDTAHAVIRNNHSSATVSMTNCITGRSKSLLLLLGSYVTDTHSVKGL